jgi:hypothetical protein
MQECLLNVVGPYKDILFFLQLIRVTQNNEYTLLFIAFSLITLQVISIILEFCILFLKV